MTVEEGTKGIYRAGVTGRTDRKFTAQICDKKENKKSMSMDLNEGYRV